MSRTRVLSLLAVVALAAPLAVSAAQPPAATFRGAHRAVRFDISPPLREIPPIVPYDGLDLTIIREGHPDEVLPAPNGFQGGGAEMQIVTGPSLIPGPSVSFDSLSNPSGVAPPDPVGDVGPSHYVAMSNLSFQIYDKTGVSVYGPALNNTLWSGFGGECQTDNSGDPIVLHDQLADRWMLTQFTSSGPEYFNCVALSVTSDPTGAYYRWAFSTGALFPDYPKYGVWSDGYYISTREFSGSSESGMGAYALDRIGMLSGDPAPVMIEFFFPPAGASYRIGDGLLPADLDGFTLPPPGTPQIYVGSQDNGGPDGAPSDALNLYEFHADFANPPASTMVLANTVPIAAFDTIFDPCGGGRGCIPQPGTANKVDILSYRQRPLHRAAYRNYGDHESLVTNQSVEGAAGIAGIQWWEIRDPAGTPTIHQQGTYAPGATDGIHRWMGSIAMDNDGNMALGFSASDDNSPVGGTYPSSWYTGRLAGDPLGTMPQGEASIINGTGSQTGGASRWGDYTSMNVDPADDCTFWYVNEYLPTTSERGWRLRVGAFKFAGNCSYSDFYLHPQIYRLTACFTDDVVFPIDVASIGGFANPVTLSATGNPGASNVAFSSNPATPGGSSTMTISNLGGVATGTYPITISGAATGSAGHSNQVELELVSGASTAPVLITPADGATSQPPRPSFSWSTVVADSYTLEIDDDADFSSITYTATVPGTSHTPTSDLASDTTYYWRVRASNACGEGVSLVRSFTTALAPGECSSLDAQYLAFAEGFESGAAGWVSSGTGSTWAASSARVHSGAFSWKAVDPVTASDQRLASPSMTLPAAPVFVNFWNHQTMESRTGGCYDGGILEISTDGGTTWTQIPGASMLTDPYDGPFSTGNPLGTVSAWCGDPQDWTRSVADVSPYAGQTVKLRFRLGSDSSVSREGWYLDDVAVTTCVANGLFTDTFEDQSICDWNLQEPDTCP